MVNKSKSCINIIMLYILKIFFLVLLFSAFGISKSYSQSRIVYSYDNSGNRVSKSAYTSHTKRNQIDIRNVMFEDDADQVRIKLPKDDSSSLYVIRVYSFTGILLYSKVGKTGTSNVSLTDYPNGIYIVKVEHDGNTISHKFIKK